MEKSLQGKIAVVTGGSQGIGLAIAKAFVAAGASVFITGRRRTELDMAVSEIGGDVTGVPGDVAKVADLDRIYKAVAAEKGKLDILVLNAGVQAKEMMGAITEEAIDYQLDVNFKGTIFSVQQALPILSPGAAIILIGSTTSIKGLPGRTVYNATKAAIRSFARTWASELSGRDIRVNVLSPGATETAFQRAAWADPAVFATFKAAVIDRTPAQRVAQPEEIAKVAVFLASDASSFVNGADIQADGGWAQI